MLHDPTFFVFVAFILFVLLAGRPIYRALGKTLDARAARIEAELAEASRLREEAAATLAAYQRKQKEAEAEAEAMLAAARETARQLEAGAREQLQRAVDARIASANDKIAREEQEAVNAIQRKVVEIAVEAARSMLSEDLNDEAHDRLITLATVDAAKTLH